MTGNKNILVCYATRYGSTEEIAGIIRDRLEDLGCKVRLCNFNEGIDLSGTDIIFAGSPLHLGKWLPEAKEFFQFHSHELKKMPVFVFTSGITLADPTEHNLLKAKFAVDDISIYAMPAATGFFAGRLSRNILSETDMQLVKIAGITDGDYIKAEEIKKWVTECCKKLEDNAEKSSRGDQVGR